MERLFMFSPVFKDIYIYIICNLEIVWWMFSLKCVCVCTR